MPEIEQREELLELTATIVEAHVSNNPIAVADLPGLIATADSRTLGNRVV